MKNDFVVILYRKGNGTAPVLDFIAELPVKHKNRVYQNIDRLQSLGTSLREPHVKPIQGGKYKGLWELRIQSSGDFSRIFYFVPVGNVFVLLHGFVKKTNKTPKRELDRAKQYMDDYERRN